MYILPIAYSYVRFSTSEQKKGDSLRRQTELSEKYAADQGLTLDNTLHLHDLGLSAFDRSNIERGALGGFLEAVKRGRIVPGSVLLVESLDRLSRDKVLDALRIFTSILDQGITIVTLADNMVYNTETVAGNIGNLIISITIMARAHEESLTKSRRMMAAWESKRANVDQKKLTSTCPRWMRLNTEKTEFELIPERVAVIKEMIAWHKAGLGRSQIAKRLNERGEPLFSTRGNGWHSSYVQRIMANPAMHGEFQPRLWNGGMLSPHGEPIPNYFPAILGKDEFHLLENIRSERLLDSGAKARKGASVSNLLSGIVKCGYCGSTMALITLSARTVRSDDGIGTVIKKQKVLVCDGARRGLGCFAIQWDYADFEKSFLTFCRTLQLNQLLSNADLIEGDKERHLTNGQQLQSINSAFEDCTKRLDRLVQLLELGETPTTVIARIRALESELESLAVSKSVLTHDMKSIEISGRQRIVEVESVRELVGQLGLLTGDRLFTVRATLAEHIRHLIQSVTVFPAGSLVTQDAVQHMRAELISFGHSAEEVEAFITQHQRTEPQRVSNKGKGRYVSQKDTGRHFIIRAKNRDMRVVYPNFDDPSEVIVDLSSNGARRRTIATEIP
jgi:DNA invertase Pin-like site-specific DNA recombinase